MRTALVLLCVLCVSAVSQSTYTLGPEDQILIRVLDAEELSAKEPIRIDARGTITMPMIGRLTAGGLTTDQLETEIETRLKKFIHDPDVTVQLTEMRSQPISILGSVQSPGVHQLQGRKTLFEALSLAGGLKTEAGHSVKITRKLEWGRIPLASARDDSTGQFSVATLKVRDIMEASNPEENILVKPNDVISVPRAELIYVVGSVKRSGGFVLGERETISTLQALALADGADRTASLKHAKIMRAVPGSDQREEIPVDLRN
jgi:polysaccharide biosynthesis/export protein